MTKLEDLLYSLTTVIIRYHDCQSGVKPLVIENDATQFRNSYKQMAIKIIHDKETNYQSRLEGLISACTKGYESRKHFLHFILNEVVFLKTIQESKQSFPPSTLEDYTNQVSQLFIDLKRLLHTAKSKTYEVRHSRIIVANEVSSVVKVGLSGLSEGTSLCRSGQLIQEEVLDTFNIPRMNTNIDPTIREMSFKLFTEHQNPLLFHELQERIIIQEASSLEHQQAISSQDQLVRQLTSRASEQDEKINHLILKTAAQEDKIKKLEAQVAHLNTKVNAINPPPLVPNSFFAGNRSAVRPQAPFYSSSLANNFVD